MTRFDEDPDMRYQKRVYQMMEASFEALKHEVLNPIPIFANYELSKENLKLCLLFFERIWEHQMGYKRRDDLD